VEAEEEFGGSALPDAWAEVEVLIDWHVGQNTTLVIYTASTG
jgi:hypothetical protein